MKIPSRTRKPTLKVKQSMDDAKKVAAERKKAKSSTRKRTISKKKGSAGKITKHATKKIHKTSTATNNKASMKEGGNKKSEVGVKDSTSPPTTDKSTTKDKHDLTKDQIKALKKHKQLNDERVIMTAANLERMKSKQQELASSPNDLYSPPKKRQKSLLSDTDSSPYFKCGDYVKVAHDYSSGMNRPDGSGYIETVSKSSIGEFILSVKYDEVDGGCLYKNIRPTHITKITLNAQPKGVEPGRIRKPVTRFDVSTQPQEATEKPTKNKSVRPIDVLKELLHEGLEKKKVKGWHRLEFGLNPKLEGIEKGEKKYVQMNEKEKTQFLYEYNMLSQHLHNTKTAHHSTRNEKTGKFSQSIKENPHSIKYFLHAWGVTKKTLVNIKQSKVEAAAAKEMGDVYNYLSIVHESEETETDILLNVIDSYEVAESKYTAEFLFIHEELKAFSESCEGGSSTRKDIGEQKRILKEEFAQLSKVERDLWECKRRSHLAMQPKVKGLIMEALVKNNSMSYEALAGAINEWCSSSTIRRWVTTREGYGMYAERIIPLLTEKQKMEHLKFSKHYRSNWGLGPGKYLVFHYDEKWFWGLLLRKIAKSFDDYKKELEERGMEEKKLVKAYHKCHISKTMGVAFLGFAFINSMENGGEGIKLNFTRAQTAKVARRKQADGNGTLLRKKGDVWFKDCSVTGSNEGTADDPKFPLLNLFRDIIFPQVVELTQPGATYEGYRVVFQGDNAGPHNDSKFKTFVQEYCKSKGWYWEPQGPQMPHVNVCDLAVFPKMSRNHSELLRKRGGVRVMKEDEIWDAAEEVWNNMPSCDIARSFVLSHRIAKKIIDAKGGNEFLSGVKGGLHSDVRKDFINTDRGVKRRDFKDIPAPARTREVLLKQEVDTTIDAVGGVATI